MQPILEIKNLTVLYGSGKRAKKALDGLSLALDKGEIFGFLGPNGAGKTTTIKTLIGLISPTEGRVFIFGKNPLIPDSRKSLGFMPEVANYYWYLTPVELLTYYGSFFGIERPVLRKRISELLKLVELSDRANSLMRTFSKGMLQKVSFAQALINDPDLLILDEPTTGLDPVLRMQMRDTLLGLKERGKTIFFSSHELSEVEIISDRVAILKDGRLLREASPKEMMSEKGGHLTLEKYFFEIVRG